MLLDNALMEILDISKRYMINTPKIVGGIPRDIHLGIDPIITKDVDLTTNGSDIIRLAVLVADSLGTGFKVFSDGHSSIYMDKYILDFSSNFISKDAAEFATGEDLYEVYSRDFTMNTLHKALDSDEIEDPTGLGKKDIDNKLIRTVMPPEITLSDDPRRVYRAINLAVRYGFEIDEKIISFVLDSLAQFGAPKMIGIKQSYITTAVGEAMNIDPEKTMSILDKLGLTSTVPLTGVFKEHLIKGRLLDRYFNEIDRVSGLA
jgi:hypothetical protein